MSFQCVKKYEDSYDKYVLLATSGKIVLPDYLDKESKKLAETVIKKNKFTAKASEKISMTLVNKKKVMDFIIIGLGENKKLDAKNSLTIPKPATEKYEVYFNAGEGHVVSKKGPALTAAEKANWDKATASFDFGEWKDLMLEK